MTSCHEKPFERLTMKAKSRMVEFRAEGGQGTGYLASPEKPHGGVLVLHAWWGSMTSSKASATGSRLRDFSHLPPTSTMVAWQSPWRKRRSSTRKWTRGE